MHDTNHIGPKIGTLTVGNPAHQSTSLDLSHKAPPESPRDKKWREITDAARSKARAAGLRDEDPIAPRSQFTDVGRSKLVVALRTVPENLRLLVTDRAAVSLRTDEIVVAVEVPAEGIGRAASIGASARYEFAMLYLPLAIGLEVLANPDGPEAEVRRRRDELDQANVRAAAAAVARAKDQAAQDAAARERAEELSAWRKLPPGARAARRAMAKLPHGSPQWRALEALADGFVEEHAEGHDTQPPVLRATEERTPAILPMKPQPPRAA